MRIGADFRHFGESSWNGGIWLKSLRPSKASEASRRNGFNQNKEVISRGHKSPKVGYLDFKRWHSRPNWLAIHTIFISEYSEVCKSQSCRSRFWPSTSFYAPSYEENSDKWDLRGRAALDLLRAREAGEPLGDGFYLFGRTNPRTKTHQNSESGNAS